MKPTPLPATTARRWRQRWCRRRPSPWGQSHGWVTPQLLPFRFGNGRTPVRLSFYGAPELCVIIPFDSSTPLDLPENLRFKANPPPSFRDATDWIEDHLHDHVHLSKARLKDLTADPDLADHSEDPTDPTKLELFSLLLRDGTTWNHA